MHDPELLPVFSSSREPFQAPRYADSKSSEVIASTGAGGGTETRRQAAMIEDDDERLLARIGYKQVHCLLFVRRVGQLNLC